MGTQLAVIQDKYDDKEVIKTIADTVCKGATPAQLRMFIEVCRSTGLSPWLKEIFYVPEKGLIMAARDGYLRVANESPNFDGIETRVERDAKNVPVKAVCTVWRKDRNHPTICEAYYSEYKKGTPVWTQYPSAMISKVAEVLALKRSFAINGCVTEEEIGDERGSTQAAQEIAQDKIAALEALKAGQADNRIYRQLPPSTVEASAEPPSEMEQQLTESIAQVEKKRNEAVDFGRMMDSFGAIKAEFEKFGAKSEYYRVLGSHGFEKSNEIRPLKLARQIYKEMGSALADARDRSNVNQEDVDVLVEARQ